MSWLPWIFHGSLIPRSSFTSLNFTWLSCRWRSSQVKGDSCFLPLHPKRLQHPMQRAVACMWRVARPSLVSQQRCMCSVTERKPTNARVPYGHWKEAQNRREFLDSIARQHNVETEEDWSRVTYYHVRDAGGAGLLKRYGNSLYELLRDTYPEKNLRIEVCRQKAPQHHWESRQRCRAFFDQLAAEHGIDGSSEAGWKHITHEMVQEKKRGASVLARYDNSVLAALQDVYGEREWDATSCRPQVKQTHWQEEENVKKFILDVRKDLGVTSPCDWERISHAQLLAFPGGSSFLRAMSLREGLAITFPKEKWEAVGGNAPLKKAAQRLLRTRVSQILA